MQKVLLLFLIVSFLLLYACPDTDRPPDISQPVVYSAGECHYTDTDYFPCYWKDTKPMPLDVPDGCTAGSANSITVFGNTIYTAGRCHNFVNTVACYWTGTMPTVLDLPDGVAGGYAVSIAVIN